MRENAHKLDHGSTAKPLGTRLVEGDIDHAAGVPTRRVLAPLSAHDADSQGRRIPTPGGLIIPAGNIVRCATRRYPETAAIASIARALLAHDCAAREALFCGFRIGARFR